DDALLQGRVVEGATQTKHAPKLPLLLGGRLEFVFVRLADRLLFHTALFRLIGAKVATERTAGSSLHTPNRVGSSPAACSGLKPTCVILVEAEASTSAPHLPRRETCAEEA